MRIQIFSKTGETLGMAMHLHEEGHNVSFNIATQSSLGDNLFNSNNTSRPDIRIYDDPMLGSLADSDRDSGTHVLGPSRWSSVVLTNPEYMTSLISLAGFPQNAFVGGTELYFTIWFNSHRYIAACLTIPRGGSLTDSHLGAVADFHQPIGSTYNTLIRPLEPLLRKISYRGALHIRLRIDRDRFTVDELIPDSFNLFSFLLFENMTMPVSDFMLRILDERSKPVQVKEQWSAGILMSLPELNTTENPLSFSINPAAAKHLWFIDVKDNYCCPVWARTHNKLGYVTARGSYPQEAIKRVYRTINNINSSEITYQTNLSRDVSNIVRYLGKHGWIQ